MLLGDIVAVLLSLEVVSVFVRNLEGCFCNFIDS